MKKHLTIPSTAFHTAILALAVAGLALTCVHKTQAQNSPSQFNIITYQGKLDDLGGGPLDGPHDFRISVVKPPLPCYGTDCGWFTNCPDCETTLLGTITAVVDKGLFTLPINMPTGAMVFGVTGNYLKMEVRPSGNGEFSTLLPMQRITAAPLATVAQSVVGPIDASTLTGFMPTGMLTGIFGSPLTLSNPSNVFAGDGSGLSHVDAATIGGLDPCNLHCYWKLTGNDDATVSSFLGTKPNVPLTIGVQNLAAIRINRSGGDGTSPNIIMGDAANSATSGNQGGIIAGGGSTAYPNAMSGGDFSVIVGGVGNHVRDQANVVGGGWHNWIGNDPSMESTEANFIGSGRVNSVDADTSSIVGGEENHILATSGHCFIGGGAFNYVIGQWSSVAGGANNRAEQNNSFVGGGSDNTATTNYATVGGGFLNHASGVAATVPGGSNNVASGSASLAAGNRAKAVNNGAFVWSDSQNADFSSTADNQFAVRAQNGVMIESGITALDLRGNGAIRVAGAGVASVGPVFIHRATVASITGHITTIDHPLCNGDPNAILIVTHNYSADVASTPYETNAVGVWYNGSRWTIYHENTSVPMPAGRAFNVMVIKP